MLQFILQEELRILLKFRDSVIPVNHLLPSILGGRVKNFTPKSFGGILNKSR
jgi:hypothetical protein